VGQEGWRAQERIWGDPGGMGTLRKDLRSSGKDEGLGGIWGGHGRYEVTPEEDLG